MASLLDKATRTPLPRSLKVSIVAACVLMSVNWTIQTANTARAWGDPLLLAQELAIRGSDSPRAQYELGRIYIIYSGYDPRSS